MKKLFLTGVPGWLGTTLLHKLCAQPPQGLQEIRCLVLPGTQAPIITSTLQISTIPCCLNDKHKILEGILGCDTVLHAAGVLHVNKTSKWYDINTIGTINLIQCSQKAGVRRFVYISSNAAAGKGCSKNKPMCESDPPNPLSHYGLSKLLAEKEVLKSPFEAVVLRPCMFYGPPVPSRHVKIYNQICRGLIPLVGHGNYQRSITYIDNLIQACLLALIHKKAPGEVFYIADKNVYTTKLILEAMAKALDRPLRCLRVPEIIAKVSYYADRGLSGLGFYNQMIHLCGEANWSVGVSIKKAEEMLGYNPEIELETGMANAIRWCRKEGLVS